MEKKKKDKSLGLEKIKNCLTMKDNNMTGNIKIIREMMEFLVKQKVYEKISKLDEIERKIYDLTGQKGQTEIVKILKISPNIVSGLWKKLELEGLLIKEGRSYRKMVQDDKI